jgi:hypothetical protein
MDSNLKYFPKNKFRIFRLSYIHFSDNNLCATALIDLFDKLYLFALNRKKENHQENIVAEEHSEKPKLSEPLLILRTVKKLKNYLLGMFFEYSIRSGLKLLSDKGFLSIYINPEPKYNFGSLNHYLFHPEIFNRWLENDYGDSTASRV